MKNVLIYAYYIVENVGWELSTKSSPRVLREFYANMAHLQELRLGLTNNETDEE